MSTRTASLFPPPTRCGPEVDGERDHLTAARRVPVAGMDDRVVLDRRAGQDLRGPRTSRQEAEDAEVHGVGTARGEGHLVAADAQAGGEDLSCVLDRKSTRLNSSH